MSEKQVALCQSKHSANLVGTDDEYNIVKVSGAANVLFHLVQP